MLDQVLGFLGQLQESTSLAQKKSFRIRKIALDAPNFSYTILAEEARTASVLTPLLEALGIVDPPYMVECKLTSDGCGLVFFKESAAEKRSLESDVLVSRKHLCGYVLTCDRPTRAKYVIMGLITIFGASGNFVARGRRPLKSVACVQEPCGRIGPSPARDRRGVPECNGNAQHGEKAVFEGRYREGGPTRHAQPLWPAYLPPSRNLYARQLSHATKSPEEPKPGE